jgi:hypothetical protein
VGKLCEYIEATSQDISQEVKAWSQMGLPNGQCILPKLWQNGLRTTKSRYWSGHHFNPIENVWAELKKRVRARRPYKPVSVTPALSGGMGQNSPNLLLEACGRLLETFDSSKTI